MPVRPWWAAIAVCSSLVAACPVLHAQPVLPVLPPPSAPESSFATLAPPTATARPTVEELAEKLKEVEATNKTLTDKLEKTQEQHDEELKEVKERLTGYSRWLGDPPAEEASPAGTGARAATYGTGGSPVPDYTEGGFTPFEPAPGYPNSNVISPYRFPLRAVFGPGFLLQTPDDRFRFQIHYESQIEGRAWTQAENELANSGIFLPRQRFFFDGHITKWVEYELAINRGLNNINLLNAYINLHLDDRFQVRLGRFFTPLPYDQYAISNYWLPTPERSIFTTNLGLNRQIGAMLWGYLFNAQVDYAAGVFNGSRNSFESLNNNLDVAAYVNARPFQESDLLPFARFLNLGTSVAAGRQNQSPVPVTFRIAGGSPDANIPGIATVPFLILNEDVVEQGDRLIGSVHAAYFYRGLSLIGEWQYGYGDYVQDRRRSSVRVPFSGFYVSGGYFLTGEHVERRTRVKPLRPFIPIDKDEACGPGAWEVAGRISRLRLGEEVFQAGLADAESWSNQATTVELGLNWYWNEYVKVYMFWLHGMFDKPDQYRTSESRKTANMFWTRFQLYF